jgi:urate oxidase
VKLLHHTYGKARVRVARVHRHGEYNEIRDLSVHTMLEGDFGLSWTEGDNRKVVATDTIKNITYIVARENLQACNEAFGEALARRLLERYPQAERAKVSITETKWQRATVSGRLHPHGFVLDGSGKPTAEVVCTREATTTRSGVAGYTFMKTTGSGWEDYVFDEYTTLPPTNDRIAATEMDASWSWRRPPSSYEAANATVLASMLDVFLSTYSKGMQDSLYRMAEAALEAVPELHSVTLACPNKHYIPMKLEPFGLSSDNAVFVATDEPYGQIECTVGR